jgi:hypothetical protein
VTSDARYKDGVSGSILGLDFLNALRPVDYFRKNDESKKREYGFIAQDVKQTLSDFHVENVGMLSEDSQGFYALRYNDFIPILTK